MTGYGRASKVFESKSITCEIRSLNSKFTDIRLKLPQNYKEKEQELIKIASESIERGKVDINLDIQSSQGDEEYSLNKALFKKYYQELNGLSTDLNLGNENLMSAILKLPHVVFPAQETLDPKEIEQVKEVLRTAVEQFNNFRHNEGKALEKDLKHRISNILMNLEKVTPFELERIEKIKARMKSHLDEFMGKENVDKNRFEQEVLFYMEKIDINEEKVRLKQHCNYFLEELESSQTLKGRKLSFIGQEIGREINTLGSKAYSSDIQRFVVNMKDELEKIKEQVANSV